MRIGVNALFLIPGEVGGSETYLLETLSALAALEAPHEWVIFASREGAPALEQCGAGRTRFRVVDLGIRASNRVQRIMAEQSLLPYHARRAGIEVLWSPGYTAPFFTRCPQVVSILDMQYKSHPEDLTRVARWTTHVLVQAAARHAKRLIAISEFSRDELVRHAGVPRERVTVTHLGVNPHFFTPVEAETMASLRHRLGIPAGPYVLCVANSYPHKNVHHAVEILTALAPEFPHRLVLVGRPRLGEARLQQALSAAPAGRVLRLQRVEHHDLVALYHGCEAFVFPSLYEGFGLPVLEALAAGVPVLTTRGGSLPEVGGSHVRYVEGNDVDHSANALRELLCMSPKEKELRRENGRSWARRFTWKETARLTLEAVEDAAHGA